MPHISLRAEEITQIAGLPITNSLIMSWITMGLLIILSLVATRNIQKIPSYAQLIAEMIIGGLYDFFSQVTGAHVRSFFPLLATIFLFVMTANWLGLLPGVGTIGIKKPASHLSTTSDAYQIVQTIEDHKDSPIEENVHDSTADIFEENTVDTSIETDMQEQKDSTKLDTATDHTNVSTNEKASSTSHGEGTALTPIFRPATADINMTVGLAIIAVLAIQYFGFALSGIHYASRFIDTRGPINAFVGILELFSEFAKIISFAFRLFGNVFAGEVLLSVMAFLMPLIVPMPFILMELFVGLIQALVFSMLTAVFLNVAVSHGEHAAHEAHAAAQRR